MNGLKANARMYAVTPAVESLWQGLLHHIADSAAVALDYLPYPAPQPLESLWTRPDLGCVLMCGYPIAHRLAPVFPIAAPRLAMPWARGRAAYRTDLIVRADSPFQTLEDTFGHRAGWTVRHSHSGFNAFRHHLLGFRRPERPTLYREMVPDLVTARAILDGVRAGRLDVGPLDGYWHWLLARHAPDLVRDTRVVASTELAPVPAFVAAEGTSAEHVQQLRSAFEQAHTQAWFAEYSEPLGLVGFAAAYHDDYESTLAWHRDAVAAGYPEPA